MVVSSIFSFHPYPPKNDPIWLSHIFQTGGSPKWRKSTVRLLAPVARSKVVTGAKPLGDPLWVDLLFGWLEQKCHLDQRDVGGNRPYYCRLFWVFPKIMGVPKSSILIRFSIISHPFWGFSSIFGNIHICWNYPPTSNSHHQGYSIFSRKSL